MTRLLIIGVVVAVIFWVISIVDCAVQPETRHRGVGKKAWIAIVVLLPVIGGVLWFAVGRTNNTARRAPIAPDDNPEFLSSIGSMYDQNERIRRIEEELARLDAEESAADNGTSGAKPAPDAEHPADGDDSPSRDGSTGATN